MEITNIKSFVDFYERTRETTVRFIHAIPPDKIDWTYLPGKFTFGDVIRHIAAVERHVFAETILNGKLNYSGCGKDLADGYDNILLYFHQMHHESMAIVNQLSDADLQKTVTAANGKNVSIANYLRALIVHEMHHRGGIAIYLGLIGIQAPPVFGLREEDLIQLSK
jgi:uncharacterized damage-inducible protein DinB